MCESAGVKKKEEPGDLGEGGFGDVYTGHRRHDRLTVRLTDRQTETDKQTDS